MTESNWDTVIYLFRHYNQNTAPCTHTHTHMIAFPSFPSPPLPFTSSPPRPSLLSVSPGRHRAADCFPLCRHRQAAACIKSVVEIHYTAAERHRIYAFIRRSARCRFVPPDSPSFETLCRTADEELFKNIKTNNQHVLHRFLPLPSHVSQNYNFRSRRHNFRIVSDILVYNSIYSLHG